MSVKKCEFSELKKSEQSKAGVLNDENLNFYRHGLSGEWKHVYTEKDIIIFRNEANEMLNLLGYEPFEDVIIGKKRGGVEG